MEEGFEVECQAGNRYLSYLPAWQNSNNGSVNPMQDGRGNRYVYDPEGQLTTAWYGAADPVNSPDGAARQDWFQYDALWNRMNYALIASMGWSEYLRRDNGLNQYSQMSPYAVVNDDTYNQTAGNGVVMRDGWITASYNALNQPRAIFSPAYSSTDFMWFGYDPLGRCVKRWVGGLLKEHYPPANTNPATYYYYDGWNLIQEGTNTGITRYYMHGSRVDEIVASWNNLTAEWVFHQYDAMGHCTLLTNLSGSINEQYDYDAFGKPYFYGPQGQWIGGVSTFGNRFLFTGREWLSDLRLYDYRARVYQPELGRFLQPDPKQFAAGDYNLYRYCHNDSVNKSDPTGLLERDKETRELKATPTGNSTTHGGVKYNEVTLKTNAGNPVSAWKAEKSAPADSTRPTDATSNCHGNTFARGEYWIEPNQTAQIVEDDGWQPAAGAQTSGIGLFINKGTNQADHSVTITGVDSNGSMIVNSKQGVSPVQVGIPLSEAGRDYPGTQFVVFTGGGDVYK